MLIAEVDRVRIDRPDVILVSVWLIRVPAFAYHWRKEAYGASSPGGTCVCESVLHLYYIS